MKYLYLLFLLCIPVVGYSQGAEWVKTKGTIADIELHRGRKTREIALVRFKLSDGAEVQGNVELFRIPFIGSMKSIGDQLTIHYNRENPAIVETVLGNFLSTYGMYILILLGIIFSIRPFLKMKKGVQVNAY